MTNLQSKIQSIRDTVGVGFLKPDKAKMDGFIADLRLNPNAMNYLQSRGLNDDTIEHFNLGYDVNKDAIAIPVYKRGELINIKYRFINPKDKQKYTSEKGCEVWLYNDEGISIAQKKKRILIVEGEFDLMSAWQAGFKSIVSPASGKDSYGVWLELLDTIPRVYISYDNDKPGKRAALDLAERVGVEKCFEVVYPEDTKDANQFFNTHSIEEYKTLITNAKPFFRYTFSGLGDIIESLRLQKNKGLVLETIPFIEFEEDWMVVISGDSGAGKTTYVCNVANELSNRGIPTLLLPFERGVRTVGKRFLQVRYKKTNRDFDEMDEDTWVSLLQDAAGLPLYFSCPKNDEIKEVIAQAKRIFNTKVVIVDHLNYLVRKSDNNNENAEVSRTLQEFKSLAQEHGIIFLIVHHIKKPAGLGTVRVKPKKEDLKGSSSIYQDPEAVIMLSSPEKNMLEVDIVKNKGPEGSKVFNFYPDIGNIDLDSAKDGVEEKTADEIYDDY